MAELQTDLGRSGTGGEQIRLALRELEAAGLVATTRRRHRAGTTMTVVPLRRPHTQPGTRWVDIPTSLLDAVAAGRAKPAHVAAAWRWLVECEHDHGRWRGDAERPRRRQRNWSDLTVGQAAAAWSQTPATVRRHRDLLVELGVLELRPRPGLPSVVAIPGRAPALAVVDDPGSRRAGDQGGVRPRRADDPGHRDVPDPGDTPRSDIGEPEATPVENPGVAPAGNPGDVPGDPCRKSGGHMELPPTISPSKTLPSSAPVGAVVTVRTARAGHDAAAPRTENPSPSSNSNPGRSGPSAAARAVLAGLPAQFRAVEPWVRVRLAELVDRTLDPPPGRAGPVLAPAAILAAARTWQHYPPVTAALADQRHIDALRIVIGLLTADVAAGSCGDCGHHHREDPTGACPCCQGTGHPAGVPHEPDTTTPPDAYPPGGPEPALPPAADPPLTWLAGLLTADQDQVETCDRCERADHTVTVRHGRLRHPTPLCQVCWSGAPAPAA
jgi:hypothetical protein